MKIVQLCGPPERVLETPGVPGPHSESSWFQLLHGAAKQSRFLALQDLIDDLKSELSGNFERVIDLVCP